MTRTSRIVVLTALVGCSNADSRRDRPSKPVAVSVAEVTRGPVVARRELGAALESPETFSVSSKLKGRVLSTLVDVSDSVERGQVVAELDGEELALALVEAEASLSVAVALLGQAANELKIADLELPRLEALQAKGIASDAELENARTRRSVRASARDVAAAQVNRATATRDVAKARLGYTKVRAAWTSADAIRVVGERWVSEGQLVAEGDPLFSIVKLEPISGFVSVSEAEYASLRPGQPVRATADAFPGEEFVGRVARLSPVFQTESRQARVELSFANEDQRLRPGMFIRASISTSSVAAATRVPEAAVTTREGITGVYLVEGGEARFVPVRLGIRDRGVVQLLEPDRLEGVVITLGHQLITDGVKVAPSPSRTQ